jgi:quercetin dioxygenase-like cupin family protein
MSSIITSDIDVASRTQTTSNANATSANYPRAIDNGDGEVLTFLGVRRDADGRQLLAVENEVQPGGGPPMHVPYLQEESLTVQEGRMGYRLAGGQDCFAGPGDTVTFAPGQMHRFWTPATAYCAARDGSVPQATSSTSSPRYSHQCGAAAAARIRSTQPTCSAATEGRWRRGTCRHPSVWSCSRFCAPWVESWAATVATWTHLRRSANEH